MKPKASFSLPAIFLLGFLLISGFAGCATATQIVAKTATLTATAPTETLAELKILSPQTLAFTFDNLPEGIPASWQVLYAPFDAGSQAPEVVKAQAQENHFMIENLGTFSGLYAFYTGEIPTANLQISLDTLPDGVNPMGVFLVCRYSTAGWYQFRISTGGSSVQYVQPQGDTFSATILAEGPGVFLDDSKHRITGICDQNLLTLQVDGQEMITKEADFLPGGSFGFGVESFNQPGGRKAFDNVEVKFLSEQTASGATRPPTQLAAIEPATPTPLPVSTAIPTSIPTPAATLRPTSIPEGELTLYQTGFDDSDPTLADWKTFAYSMDKKDFVTEGFKTWTVNGIFRFEQQANTRAFAIYEKDLGTSDVDISTSGGAPFEGHGGLGLVCRYSAAGWYQFMVEPREGAWSIRLVKPDENGQFHFHIISSGLHKWLGQKVDLRAECKGDQLSFFIDGENMASLHDSTFPTGKVGFLGWTFTIGDNWNTLDMFSARRAQWSETGLPGPAPTPGADGTIYSTDFTKLDDLNPYWKKTDWGVIGVPGSPILIGGPGGQVAPHTYLYINDFDPAADVEISADIHPLYLFRRGLICRYSEDGWYEAYYLKDGKENPIVLLRKQREEQGKFTGADTILGTAYAGSKNPVNLTLTCAGNQISVKLNGEQILYAEDKTWTSGRYGFLFMDNPPGNIRNTLHNYIVRPAQALHPGEVIFQQNLNTPGKIMAFFTSEKSMVVQEDAIITDPGVWFNISTSGYLPNDTDTTIEVQFLNSEGLVSLGCRNGPNPPAFQLRPDGSWAIFADNQMKANGKVEKLVPGKNQIRARCIGKELTLVINGETIGSVEDGHADERAGQINITSFEGVEFALHSVNITASKGLSAPPTYILLNQVSLPPAYLPGETIFAWDMNNFISGCGDGWWGRDANPCLWRKAYNQFEIWEHHTDNDILVTSNEKKLTLFTFQPDLYDLPIEISVEATLTSKGGGVALFCRASANGRYEFTIQPNGKWFIRRNVIFEDCLPQAKHLTILAQGTVENFSPENMQMSATCSESDLVFTLNGEELGRVQDTLYPEGQAGIFFDVFSEGVFTNWMIKRAK